MSASPIRPEPAAVTANGSGLVSSTARAEIIAVARRWEIDRTIAASLAPKAVRLDLITLAAFSAELFRIADQVRDPVLGEIRVQWWRDALLGRERDAGGRTENRTGNRTGHPVADAFTAVMKRHQLPHDVVSGLLDAHAHRLYADPPVDDAALDLELDLIEGGIFRCAARILGGDDAADAARAVVRHGGRAYGLMRIGATLGAHLARGREPLPVTMDRITGRATAQDAVQDETLVASNNAFIARDWAVTLPVLCQRCRTNLIDMQHAMARLDADNPTLKRAIMAAMLPVAVVEPHLRALQRADHDPLRHLAEINPLQRVWRIGKSHAMGRI